MTIADMKEKDSGVLLSINECCHIKRRLYDIGFVKGQKISCLYKNPFGSPIAYYIDGAIISLRKSDAAKIGVIL